MEQIEDFHNNAREGITIKFYWHYATTNLTNCSDLTNRFNDRALNKSIVRSDEWPIRLSDR